MGNKIIKPVFGITTLIIFFLIISSFLRDYILYALIISLVLSGFICYQNNFNNKKLLSLTIIGIISLVSIPLLLYFDTDVFKKTEIINSFLDFIGWKKYNEGMGLKYLLKILNGLLLPIFLLIYGSIYFIINWRKTLPNKELS